MCGSDIHEVMHACKTDILQCREDKPKLGTGANGYADWYQLEPKLGFRKRHARHWTGGIDVSISR